MAAKRRVRKVTEGDLDQLLYMGTEITGPKSRKYREIPSGLDLRKVMGEELADDEDDGDGRYPLNILLQ